MTVEQIIAALLLWCIFAVAFIGYSSERQPWMMTPVRVIMMFLLWPLFFFFRAGARIGRLP
jgi:hypothetical protein